MTDSKEAVDKARKEQEIYQNFATPLVGSFLNLPCEPTMVKCPSCGLIDLSKVESELKWWAVEINHFLGCLFVSLCCCCCFDYSLPCKSCDRNHYCKNCGCYFGRTLKHKTIKTKGKK